MPNVIIDPHALDKLFRPFDRTDAPGYAIGIAAPGQVPYRRGFGMASVELPVALSPTIRMRIGSTSKHFTALAILLLAEEGRLSIEDSPRTYLPELPSWADAITIRQLLAHTSGMRDSLDLLLFSAGAGRAASPAMQINYLASLDSVNFAPGTSWNYNNGGYVLATEIVARASGQSFADFLRDRIFIPVGMHNTLLRWLDTDLVPNSATLHVPRPDGGWDRGVFGTEIGGEGGIASTVDDMLRWLEHMRQPTVGSAASWAAIKRPQVSHGYGLGLFNERRRGLQIYQHAGAVVGGSCQMVTVEEPTLDIVILSNGLPGMETYRLINTIIDQCIPGLPAAAVGRSPDRVVTGTFHSAATGRVIGLTEADGKQAVRFGAVSLAATADDAGALSVEIIPSDMRLTVATDGERIDLVEFGAADRLDRVIPPHHVDATAIAGKYANATAGITAAIDGVAATMSVAGMLGDLRYRLVPLSDQLWEAQAEGPLPIVATMEFSGGSFMLTTGRTTRLLFERTA